MTDRPAPGYTPARGEAKFPDLTLHKPARLSDLVKEGPKQYDGRVMKEFEAFLAFPPGFGCQIGGLTAE